MHNFYRNKKIFITGNTGFKGSWLSYMLLLFESNVCGYSDKRGRLFELCNLDNEYETYYGDIRDYENLRRAISSFNPDIVIHMAAQPLVIEGYNNPRETFDVNVMGTVNLMSALEQSENLGSMVNVTTDKVYRNEELTRPPYREDDRLGGEDPYSCSKACSELVTEAFRQSFNHNYNIATARAGNVIGGGDFAENRIIPDCIKSAEAGEIIKIRNPNSVRPWQHVLEPLNGYLTLAKALYENQTSEAAFNFGPELSDCVSVGKLADIFCSAWGNDLRWDCTEGLFEEYKNNDKNLGTFKESNLLTLDSSKAQRILNWTHQWNVSEAVKKTVQWHKSLIAGEDIKRMTTSQIQQYLAD